MLQRDTTMHKGLSAKNASVSYGQTAVFQSLSFRVKPRTLTALIGSNGSGKSTILRMLAGLIKPRSGSILLDGCSIFDLSVKQMARRIGVLSQGPVAPEGLKVEDLVRQGRYPHRSLFGRWSVQDDKECNDALRLTGMDDFRDRQLDSLSGGQRQRAWISMALAQQTDILLLDEPTTYLDLAHQIEIMELAVDLVRQNGKTVVAVLHDLNQAARYADCVLLLKEGSIIAAGTPDAVITAENIANAFGVLAEVCRDPFTGTPMYIPLPRQKDRDRSEQ